MEHYKMPTLLNDSPVSNFITGKWSDVNYLLNGQYPVNKSIRFKTPMLRPDLCNHSNAYIAVKGALRLKRMMICQKEMLHLKNNATFRSCITKIKSILTNNTDLDIAMLMYKLLEYSDNYSMASESLWNYYRDEVDDDNKHTSDGNYQPVSCLLHLHIKDKDNNNRKIRSKTSTRWKRRRY